MAGGVSLALLALVAGQAVSRNAPPEAQFTREAHSGSLLTVRFDATVSTDPEGSIARYLWSFGDGGSGSGPVVTHTYARPGGYLVELVVFDDRGVSDALAARIDLSETTGVYPLGTGVGHAAPPFSLADLDGEAISLEAFHGKVVILEFWASWCVPCHDAMAALGRILAEVHEAGVWLLAVSLDRYETALRRFVADKATEGAHVLWGSWDEAVAIKELYDVGEIPHLIVIDRMGVIRFTGHFREFDEGILMEWL